MKDIDPYQADPARLIILQRQDDAQEKGVYFEPTAEELRLVLVQALPETAGVKLWAGQLGCTPAFLQDVLDGREAPAGDMLDILGLEWLPEHGVYADPLYDEDARTIQQDRWAGAPTCETYRPTPPCPRIERFGGPPLPDIFAIGAGSPGPRKKG
ncbi:hypothetical protein [Methylorubrum thiocyanatum]|uniref:hypothetical protein n=1 Tax=Methylorubrum thiocyanatum TaxID=47958 RepID=UPI0035C7CBD2